MDTLSSSQIERYWQYSYIASLLALPSMACAKFSVLHLQKRLMGDSSSNRYMKRMYLIVGISILTWAVFSVIAIALQCGTTNAYRYKPQRCADGALWYPVTILNALTDAILTFSFTPVVLGLAMKKEQKIRVMLLFGTRLW